ncbi:MAG: hypothetical protein LUH03_05835 [Oscillospiraceae bacterium]|nr:hypothetical protein [Oscillospiraceae bacterium]
MFNEVTLPYGYKLQNWDYSYIIDNVQGQGGFGITYSAYRAEDNLHVAVKEFFPNQLNLTEPFTQARMFRISTKAV